MGQLEQLTAWLITLSPLWLLAPVTIVCVRYRQLSDTSRRIGFYIGLAATTSLVTWIMWRNRANNLPVLHVYTVLEFYMVSWFFNLALRGFMPRWLIPGLVIGFTVFAVLNTLFLQPLMVFNTYARGLEALLIIIYSVMLMSRILHESKVSNLQSYPAFWFSVAFLAYFSLSLFLFALSDHILQASLTTRQMIWAMHSIFALVFYLLISIGLWNDR